MFLCLLTPACALVSVEIIVLQSSKQSNCVLHIKNLSFLCIYSLASLNWDSIKARLYQQRADVCDAPGNEEVSRGC